MKISLFNKYGAKNSVAVFQAIAQGLVRCGHSVVAHDWDADAAVIWSMLWQGRMYHNRDVWQKFQGRPIIVAEVGIINRNKTWKIGLGGTGADSYNLTNLVPGRAQILGIQLRPWRQGSHIVIATQRADSQQWIDQPGLNQWLEQTVSELRKYTDRSIVIRQHPRGHCIPPLGSILQVPQFIPNSYDSYDFEQCLQSAWAVLNWSSGPGPQSLIAGVPVFVGPQSLASSVANWDLSQIENPPRPDRSDWIERLAHTEWTLEEISQGMPFKQLGV